MRSSGLIDGVLLEAGEACRATRLPGHMGASLASSPRSAAPDAQQDLAGDPTLELLGSAPPMAASWGLREPRMRL